MNEPREIIEITKEKGKYILTLDRNETITLTEETIIKFNLLRPCITYDIEKIMEYDIIILGRDKIMKFLSYSKTRKEVLDYMTLKNIPSDSIKLISNEFINDTKYAFSYLEYHKKYNKKGPLLINEELRHKGISDDIISSLVYGSQIENIISLIKKKKNEPKSRIYHYLIAKGYNNDIILDLLEKSDEIWTS